MMSSNGKFIYTRFIVLFIFILLISLICACESQPTNTRISDEELSQIRGKYPYNDTDSALAVMESAQQAYPNFDAFMYEDSEKKIPKDFRAVVVLKIVEKTDDIRRQVNKVQSDEASSFAAQKTPGFNQVDIEAYDAVIEKILWKKADINVGDRITIGLGTTLITYGMELEKVYVEGEKLVCFLVEPYNDYGKEGLFATSKAYTFYLTKKNVLLSVSSAPGPDSVSGMYLDAFTTLVNETLGPPDAELTPVEPELEAE